MSDQLEPTDQPVEVDEIELSDDALDLASGGDGLNGITVVYASTFIPFDSSF